jgi:hypothetical protein
MALSKTDKNKDIMKYNYGTICLITQAGVSDSLLEIHRKNENGKKTYSKQPVDSWDI